MKDCESDIDLKSQMAMPVCKILYKLAFVTKAVYLATQIDAAYIFTIETKRISMSSINKPAEQAMKKTKAQLAAEKRARQIARLHKKVAPKLPHIDPHDLDLILDSLLKTPEERMQFMFLKRHEDGSHIFDEGLLSELIEALTKAELEVIFIDDLAAMLHGLSALALPHIDLMVRDNPQLQIKLEKFARIFGVTYSKPYQPLSKMIRAIGRPVSIDFVFELSSRKSFESIRSRAKRVRIGKRMAWVASLEDIIAAKEAANRPKDRAKLQILKETLETKNVLNT